MLWSSPDGIAVIDVQARFRHVNPALCRLLGYDSAAFADLDLGDIDRERSRARWIAMIGDLRRTDQALVMETRLRTRDGRGVPVKITALAVRQGQAHFILVTINDLTERKRLENRRDVERQFLEAVLRINRKPRTDERAILEFALESCTGITGSRFGFLGYVNDDETLMTILAWSRDAMGACAMETKPIEYPVAAAGIWAEPLRNRRPHIVNDYSQPHPHKHGLPGGHVAIRRYLGVPVFEGEHIAMIVAVANKEEDYGDEDASLVSALISAALHVVQRNRDGEALRQRNDELLAACVRAETASRTKSAFLAAMSHELRTPLNAVLGFSQLLAQTETNPERREQMEIINLAGEHLLQLIQGILDFSRIEAGKIQAEAAEFSLRHTLNALRAIFGTETQNPKIRFSIATAPDVPDHLIGDPKLLTQVLVNLVGNAFKFTASGRIDVSVVRDDGASGDEPRFRFTVSDTGIGIRPENQRRIFEEFEQEAEILTRSTGGAGLGLAIAKRLVNLMKGRIWLESSPGVGSRFHFTAALGIVGKGIDS